jgi:hypothetical protein
MPCYKIYSASLAIIQAKLYICSLHSPNQL